MILILEIPDDPWPQKEGHWDMIEGRSVASLGSYVQIRHLRRNATARAQNGGRVVGYAEVVGFKASNKANEPLARFARNIEGRR